MSALNLPVFITTLQEHLEISQGLKNTTAGNMGRRNGSVTNAQRSMLSNPIGRLTLKPVAQENIDVTVELSSPGIYN